MSRTRVAVHRATNGPLTDVESTGYRWAHLVGGAPLDTLNVFQLVFPPHETMQTMVSHPCQEYCYVLEGEMLFYAGDQVHRLRAGEGIMIDSEIPHRAERAGDAPTRILMAVSRPASGAASPEWWNLSRATAAATTTANDVVEA